jgi:hypothetical protein
MPLVAANRMTGGGARYANKQMSREHICKQTKEEGSIMKAIDEEGLYCKYADEWEPNMQTSG